MKNTLASLVVLLPVFTFACASPDGAGESEEPTVARKQATQKGAGASGGTAADSDTPARARPSFGGSGSESTPPPEPDSAGGGGAGGAGGKEEGESPPSSGSCGAPTCDAAGVATARRCFCDALNDSLAAKNIAERIDCEALDGAPAGDRGVEDPRYERCRDLIDPHLERYEHSTCKPVESAAERWFDQARSQLVQHAICDGSPLVLDLDGDGIQMSTVTGGVTFDLLGGGAVRTAWVNGGDAFLTLDRNGNGRVDSGRELFGNATGGGSWAHGFEPLAALDLDGNGRIDARDPAYAELLLWTDRDHDGVSSPSELVSLREAGIRSLDVTAVETPASYDAAGNSVRWVSTYERRDGTRGLVGDAFFRFGPARD